MKLKAMWHLLWAKNYMLMRDDGKEVDIDVHNTIPHGFIELTMDIIETIDEMPEEEPHILKNLN